MSETPATYGDGPKYRRVGPGEEKNAIARGPEVEYSSLHNLLAIHEQVREFVERECNCKVTRICGSSSTMYGPPMGAIQLTSTAGDIRAMDFLLERVDASFMVEAVELGDIPGLEISIDVGIVSNMAGSDSHFVVMRRRGWQ